MTSYCSPLIRLIHRGAWNRNSANFALRVGLLLDHRFGWLRSGYGVRMSVHDLPSAIFGPEDARDAQSHGANILTAANLGPVALHLHDAGKLGGNVLRHVLEAYNLAIPVVGAARSKVRAASSHPRTGGEIARSLGQDRLR